MPNNSKPIDRAALTQQIAEAEEMAREHRKVARQCTSLTIKNAHFRTADGYSAKATQLRQRLNRA